MTDEEYTAERVQIGGLARATGLTVRTLHHYDEIGLLVADERSYRGGGCIPSKTSDGSTELSR